MATGGQIEPAQRIRAFIRWSTLLSVVGCVFVTIDYLIFRLPFLITIDVTLVINLAMQYWGRRRVEAGQVVVGVVANAAGTWVATIGLAYAIPSFFPLVTMLFIHPVLISLPFIAGRALKLVMVGSAVTAVVSVALCLSRQVPLTVPPALVFWTYVAFVPAILVMFFIMMWQYSSRLNETLEKTRQANEALRGSERVLEEKVRSRTRELADARDQALAATRAKSAFLANMSHELRTPLNAILGYSELLAEQALEEGKPGFVADLHKVRSAGTHLLALINDVLDISKVEAGRMDLAVESFGVAAVVDEAVNLIRPLVKPGVQLEVRCGPHLGQARTDLTKLRQALFNLLSNASKFTDAGRITLEAQRRPGPDGEDRLVFAISDTGIGMSSEELASLFQPFVQGSSPGARKHGGTGLGLALSRRFCQLMGGDIVASSEPGLGSCFTIEIPAAAVDTRPPAATRAAQAPAF